MSDVLFLVFRGLFFDFGWVWIFFEWFFSFLLYQFLLEVSVYFGWVRFGRESGMLGAGDFSRAAHVFWRKICNSLA